MINALDKLDNSKPMSRHVDDASSALYIIVTLRSVGGSKNSYTHTHLSKNGERLKHIYNEGSEKVFKKSKKRIISGVKTWYYAFYYGKIYFFLLKLYVFAPPICYVANL